MTALKNRSCVNKVDVKFLLNNVNNIDRVIHESNITGVHVYGIKSLDPFHAYITLNDYVQVLKKINESDKQFVGEGFLR